MMQSILRIKYSFQIKLILFLLASINLTGCDVANAERAIMRFAMEEGLKAGCEGNTSCVNSIETHLDHCLTDADLDALIKTPNAEYDEVAFKLATNVFQCIQNQ